MMPATGTTLLTVEEFLKIPDPPGGRYELRHGELALMPPPIFQHAVTRRQIMFTLERICNEWFVSMAFAFRPLPEYELWVADVAVVPAGRARTIPMNGWLAGAPDLAVEVISPSNTLREINDREQICFQGGCREFWVVDPDLRTIRVSTPDGQGHTYRMGDEVPLDRFSPGKLAIADLFPEQTLPK